MRSAIILATALTLCVQPVFGKGGGHSHSGGHSSSHRSHSSGGSGTGSKSSHTSAKSYTKKNGTHVKSYQKTTPDHTQKNNYSAKRNYNPSTGKTGTKKVKR